tara:strand:- start:971 stop:1162 length:192 start_codon:yes stop_codon:yes gene_type:complete
MGTENEMFIPKFLVIPTLKPGDTKTVVLPLSLTAVPSTLSRNSCLRLSSPTGAKFGNLFFGVN